jgi:hypothetical protein
VYTGWLLLAIATSALAQGSAQTEATVAAGVPLRLVLDHRVRIDRPGRLIAARLLEPVFVYDRLALPAGTIVEGHIAKIGGVPIKTRVEAILNGNFTPPREALAQFDTLVLGDGSRRPLLTGPAFGMAHTLYLAERTNRQSFADRLKGMDPLAPLALGAPGRMARLKARLFAMLPYHRQAWPAGTVFVAELREPLTVAASDCPGESGSQEVHARLLTPISSATARKGAPVEAVVTRPLFSADHALLIPEGSRLLGSVVDAQPARPLHRNGKLRFVFQQLTLPEGAVQPVRGYLEGVETDRDAQLALDAEGAARVSSSPARLIFPAIATAVAGLSLHQDYNARGVPDQDAGGRAESGAVGLGLVGTLVAQASRPLASTIAFTGAAFSIYSTFLARGANVVLRANTPLEVNVAARPGEEGAERMGKAQSGHN